MAHGSSPNYAGPWDTGFNERQPDIPQAREQDRFCFLASLPVPPAVPEDALRPIMIPSPFTLHEFLGNTTGVSHELLFYYIKLIQLGGSH